MPRAIWPAAAVSLHPYGADDDVGRGVPPGQHLENIPQRSAVQRGDDPDLAGEQRQRAFPARLEQSVGCERAFQLVERDLQRAHTLRL